MGKRAPHILSVPTLSWRILATFADRIGPRTYLSPDIRRSDPGWGSEIFNRQISSVEFFLPTGHRVLLAGMEAYNFFVEASESLSGRGSARIEAFWLCGKLPGQPVVEMWRIGNGKVTRQRKPWGKEWGGGPTRGWKAGGGHGNPVSHVIED